ncbi:MAG: hypothetical protein FJ034_06775, partial [Chloroflexi bacterium]|nr:hypothetical protein [Chloroflexota bacterium]
MSEREDRVKAVVWSALAAAALIGHGWLPYALFAALGHALLLPAAVLLHVRGAPRRDRGAVLATAAATAAAVAGMADLVVPLCVLTGMWWWTLGKMCAETGILPRAFGLVTMAGAVLALAAAAVAPTDLLTISHARIGIGV